MKEMTISEIVFFWNCKYKYDHLLHGFSFKEKEKTNEEAHEIYKNLNALYGSIKNG